MLDHKSTWRAHALQCSSLVLLSLLFVPANGLLVLSCYIFGHSRFRTIDARRQEVAAKDRYTVLVTGVGMSKGLTLARLFYQGGHQVVGADFDRNACGSVSRAIARFHSLKTPTKADGTTPYIQSLLKIITEERVDLWVSCSGVASAIEDGQAKQIVEERTKCRAVQFDAETTQRLHEKDTFIAFTEELGLNVPQTHAIKLQTDAENILRNQPDGMRFIMKPIGMDDGTRGNMSLLPMETKEKTMHHLEHLRITKERPYIMQHFVKGDEFCTHSLVVRGAVLAFVACPSSELLMHYERLPTDSPLRKAMLKFTVDFARRCGEMFTGHLSFDFIIEDTTPSSPDDVVLYPIECNPRAHTAVVLFKDNQDLVDAYLTTFNDEQKVTSATILPGTPRKYYWVGHDLITLLIVPMLEGEALKMLHNFWTFLCHILFWTDGTLETWDPLPFFWLYHIYWPTQFIRCLYNRKKWSRINVSTTKMFEC